MRQFLKTAFRFFCEQFSRASSRPSGASAFHFNTLISAGIFLPLFFSLLEMLAPSVAHCQTRLTAVRVEKVPRIDGFGQDPAWKSAPEITTRDVIANLDVALKAVYTDEEIFFLVRFADPDESRIQKAWEWNKEKKLYEIGPLREDCFIFKWAMDGKTTDLSIFSDEEYHADIWFWKANRTDPAGFADDKHQLLTSGKIPGAPTVISRSGKVMYLKRKGDAGAPAYKNQILVEYAGEIRPQFLPQAPSGSRADIRAKGIWTDKEWCLEFGRKLVTGNADDVQFDVAKEFLFGISRNEIAAREPDPNLSQPLYGAGDVSEKLILIFAP